MGIFAMAAGPKAYLPVKEFNFGTINEEGGKVSHVFEVFNKGDQPLLITSVEPTCGCTTKEYTKNPIAKGGNGQIKVTYNPSGRPGPFTKTINVSTNDCKTKLVIKGEVTPKSK